jgi:hypothetical protein
MLLEQEDRRELPPLRPALHRGRPLDEFVDAVRPFGTRRLSLREGIGMGHLRVDKCCCRRRNSGDRIGSGDRERAVESSGGSHEGGEDLAERTLEMSGSRPRVRR